MVDMLITSLLPDERGKTPVGNSVEKHLGYPQGKRGETSSTKVWGNPHVLSPFINRF